MSRRRGQRRRKDTRAAAAASSSRRASGLGGRRPADILSDSIPIPRPLKDGRLVAPAELDSLVPEAGRPEVDRVGLREPPALIVEPPERLAARRARDERDGVEVADPRRRGLYVGIAVFVTVALLVFAVLSLIDSRDLLPMLVPSR